MRETPTIEGSTPVEIAALVLQLLANESDNRKTAKIAKEIISRGGFSGINLSYVPVDKALFLLDMLEMGRRKYRENLSRKNNFESNIIDIFVRLSSHRRNLFCSRCGQSGHTERMKCKIESQQTSNIENLISSLTISTNVD